MSDDFKVLKKKYLPGTRIQLDALKSSVHDVQAGEKGTVIGINENGQLVVQWDNGVEFSISPQSDSFKLLNIDDQIREAEAEKERMIENRTRGRTRGKGKNRSKTTRSRARDD